jgi:hypothetical protein
LLFVLFYLPTIQGPRHTPQKTKTSFRPERSAVEKPAFQPIPSKRPSKRIPLALAVILFAATLTLIPTQARSQGCTQCQDNTAAIPHKTQAAYRHAIIFMTLTAGSLFLGTLVVLKRHR